MIVIAVCIALVAGGVVVVARWGGVRSEPHTRGWLKHCAVALAAGMTAGVLAAGAGGRLAMRLLAVTSPDARGSITEANEVVGEITAEGTLGFVIFVGLPAGFLSAVLYALTRPILPPGRAGGLILGLLLLLLAGTTLEPLRADNPDFDIVGPSWLSLLVFTVLALFNGLVVAAVGERLDRRVELSGRSRRVAQVVLAVVALVALPGFVAAVGDIL